MVPLRLNLLSEEKRRAHNRTIYVQFIKNVLEVLFIIVCVCGILLLLGKRWLDNRLRDVASHQIVSDSKYLHANQKIDAVNKRVKRLDDIQKTYILWTPIIREFTAAIPPDVTLSTFTLDLAKRSVSLTGTAPTRDALIAFKTRLEAVPWVTPFTIPIDQLTNKENVAFSFSVDIKE